MKIAVEGCAHGDLDNIYATLQYLEGVENIKIDLLICCGDFQAVRNEVDLESLACPPKFRAMNSFWKYYSGEAKAPYPTLFVGGNHEASNYLWELYYGGFVAPNIYFLGFAGVVRFGGVRIGGLSGIFKDGDYWKGHFERAPYSPSDIRSIYHVRDYDVRKLKDVKGAIDIFISHDWPRGIARHGNFQQLLRHKPFLQQEIEENTLGSKPGEELLHKLMPKYWFSAHLHTRFSALVRHANTNQVTKFLALDKCLPNRNFLQVIDVPGAVGPLEFAFDEDWLSITRAYHPYLPLSRRPAQMPGEILDLEAHQNWVRTRVAERGLSIPSDFTMTVPPFDANRPRGSGISSGHVRNPQTEAFLQLLELPYLLDRSGTSPGLGQPPASLSGSVVADPDEILLEDDDSGEPTEDGILADDVDELEASRVSDSRDPDEILLPEDEEDDTTTET